MALKDLVIPSQLIPPRQRRGILRRPRLEARLESVLDYPLTLVQAGTGYGKSTALVALTSVVNRLFWYTISEPDRDPLLFLAHLIRSFDQQEPGWGEPAIRALEESSGHVTPAALTPLLNILTIGLDEEAVLVLDDYHLVANVPEIAALVERLVDYLSPRLHLVISSRYLPAFPAVIRWRVKGQLLNITGAYLAFTVGEIEALFREQYGYPISPEQAKALATETEGWAIALQMVWQGLQSGGVPDLDAVLGLWSLSRDKGRLPSSLDVLFDYLAQEVLARQPPVMQRFLLSTSMLRQMNGLGCDCLQEAQGSATTLRLLEAQEHSAVAQLLEEIGAGLVRLGRLDSLSTWIARLPKELRMAHPGLELLLGDVFRLRAHFDEALDQYAAAECRYLEDGDRLGRSQALGSQAQVYLDMVRPLRADTMFRITSS